MNGRSYWQSKNDKCLIWDEATDDEFEEVLEKLHKEIEKGNL